MTRTIILNAGRFVLLILLQVMLFNNIEIKSYIIPQIYILFILLLPLDTPKWLLLPAAFLTGFFIDLFMYIPGLHAAACTLAGFLRPGVFRLITPKQDYEAGSKPVIQTFGPGWFFRYSFILISAHHFVLYALDEFRLSFAPLLYYVINVIFTTVAVLLAYLVFYRRPK
jgi:hypothetical protein